MTPEEREAKSNEFANMVLAELRVAKTPEECAAISQKHSKGFARLQQVNPVRAIHIVNLASLMKAEFEREARQKNKEQMDLWG